MNNTVTDLLSYPLFDYRSQF